MIQVEIDAKAPVSASTEITIEAPVELAWNILTNIEEWPKWDHAVQKICMQGALQVGTSFDWTTGVMRIRSEVLELSSPSRLVWSGKTLGMCAIRVWQLERRASATHLLTEESLSGFLPSLFPRLTKMILEKILSKALVALKVEAERQFNKATWIEVEAKVQDQYFAKNPDKSIAARATEADQVGG